MGTAHSVAELVSDERLEQFRTDGFTSFDRFIDADALAGLRDSYDRVLSKETDCGDNDRQLGGLTRQIMGPSLFDTSIRANAAFTTAQAVAGELLGCDEAEYLFDMMIFKPAGHPIPTPWHQDLGYFHRPFTAPGMQPRNFTLQFWIAVDDADVENGCMHFVPGQHTRPMPEHYIYSGDPDYEGRLLAIKDWDHALPLDTAVACPLPAGGATVHTEGTPHYTPPNTSADRDRRAYIVNFKIPGAMYEA